MLFAKIFLINKNYIDTGLGTDAKILKNVLPHSDIYYLDDIYFPKSKVNIFIEVLPNKFLTIKSSAKINILLVNFEFIGYTDVKLIKHIDIAFAKNIYSINNLKLYRKHFALQFKIYYTKFTSIINNENFQYKKKKNQIVHLAGRSGLKNTDIIYKVWESNKHYPLIKITCYDNCFTNLCKYMTKPLNQAMMYNKKMITNRKIKNLKNLIIYDTRISNNQFHKLYKNSECYLCPSYMEGFGHYINEGRGNGALVITTNGSPMNELIDNSCGILIDAIPLKKTINGFTFIRSYQIEENSLKKAVDKYLSLSKEEKDTMRKKSYFRFKKDDAFFKKKMEKFYKMFSKL